MQEEAPTKRFQRHAEDFICGHCGFSVTGNGFTNHCPRCLYSQHVDINPGDRSADCQGLMPPVAIEPFGDSWKIVHRCGRCQHERKNKIADGDDFAAVLTLQKALNRNRFYGSAERSS